MNNDTKIDSLFSGLTALSASSFPKQCPTCLRKYETAEDYVRLTLSIKGNSGLKASEDDDGSPILELFRNCHCGSTLLDFFKDRRDPPEQRQLFGDLLEHLCERGIDRSIARQELLKVRSGQTSTLINELNKKR